MKILIETYALLKGVISNDLEWPWVSEIFNDTKHLRQLSFFITDCRAASASEVGLQLIPCCINIIIISFFSFLCLRRSAAAGCVMFYLSVRQLQNL